MRLSRRILSHPLAVSLLCQLAAGYIRLVGLTSRVRWVGREHVQPLWDARKPAIYAFWHGRLFYMSNLWPKTQGDMHVLISRHRDGELIARAVKHFGFRLVRGSTRKEGAAAAREVLAVLEKGGNVTITPDGPRGPRMRAGRGAVALARLSGVPVVPVSFSASRCKVLRSWDRFLLPLPFGKIAIRVGAPLTVPADATETQLEDARQLLEDMLNRLTREADQEAGIAPVEPAPPHTEAQNAV